MQEDLICPAAAPAPQVVMPWKFIFAFMAGGRTKWLSQCNGSLNPQGVLIFIVKL